MEDKKEYTAKEVADSIIATAKDLLAKAEVSPKQAAAEIKGDGKVNEVLPKVAPDKRDDVLKELRMEKTDPRNQTSAQMAEVNIPQPKPPQAQEKVIAKQPLQLKKFMEKCSMKKADKEQRGVHNAHFGASSKSGTSDVGARVMPDTKISEGTKNYIAGEHKRVISELKSMSKPNLPKSEKGN